MLLCCVRRSRVGGGGAVSGYMRAGGRAERAHGCTRTVDRVTLHAGTRRRVVTALACVLGPIDSIPMDSESDDRIRDSE